MEVNNRGYTFSLPAEHAWIGRHAVAKGYSGYLFRAYNAWIENPLPDSYRRRHPTVTLSQFYPGPRTSILFEKIIEGIQAFKKIRILKEKFKKEETTKISSNWAQNSPFFYRNVKISQRQTW